MNPDLLLFRLINGVAGTVPLLDAVMRFLANDYVIPTALAATLVFLWFSRDERLQQAVIRAGLALLLANGIVKLINLIWYRPRPFTYHDVHLLFYFPSDSSFPANSAAAMFALAGTIWLVDRPAGSWMLLAGATMALARVYVGVHYPFDVLGGAAIGIVSAMALQRLSPYLRPLAVGLARLSRRLGLA
ncbi:MAG: undecaprenyl-diphosphatase [Ardenticatenaceae bacterium]|nr:undecaprenyl-diphosphatase [Ardenticatenaceae bacterium]